MEILRIENLTFSYPGAEKPSLKDVSFSVNRGDFLVLCGQSGCGKTTLLKMLKPALTPFGNKSGRLCFNGKDYNDLDDKTASGSIGYVLQNPDSQIVTDKVWHELAFGLESLGYKNDYIRLRVGEMASYFGITEWFRNDTANLSGGQKQLLNLASVMAMSPDILILDEPTSQLDPVAANDFLTTLRKLNLELGLTIIMSEHRLEELFSIADKIAVLEDGRLISYASPSDACMELRDNPISAGFPTPVRLWQSSGLNCKCPLSIREGREFIENNYKPDILPINKVNNNEETILELREAWFRYTKNSPDILRGVSIKIKRGEIFSLLGGNGSGKTTTLKVLAGLERIYRGQVLVYNKNIKSYTEHELHRHCIAMLPQNPSEVFIHSSVHDDYMEICKTMGYSSEDSTKEVEELTNKLNISDLLDRHPYDLSGGEQQKCALAKVLLLKPSILLLDEPTKGIDAYSKLKLIEILKGLRDEGITIFCVTHDVEFAAVISDRAALYFDGEILSPLSPRDFFENNNFYTTAASRISRGVFKGAVTTDAVLSLMEKNNYEESD